MPRRKQAASSFPLLNWNDDRLAFLRNQEIDSPRPLCRARVLDEVNSLVRIRAESPHSHHVRRAALRFMSQRTFEHIKKFRSRMIVLRAHRSGRQVRNEHDNLTWEATRRFTPSIGTWWHDIFPSGFAPRSPT